MSVTTMGNDGGTLSERVSRLLGRDGDYEHSWEKTGPLIEAHRINIERLHAASAQWRAWRWICPTDPVPLVKCLADTPLLAICNLIVELAEAGKLEVPK